MNSLQMVLKADLAPIKYYHASSWAAAGLLPLGLMIKGPGIMSFPVDLALGVALPVHSHMALNYVISDYAAKISKNPAFATGLRLGVLGMTVVTVLGLTKLNLAGPGISETIKTLWRPKKAVTEA